MIFLGFAIDQDDIYTYEHKLIELFCKDCVHDALEGGWGICQPKWHSLELSMAIVCFKGCLDFIIW
jgi:hypothetical protein